MSDDLKRTTVRRLAIPSAVEMADAFRDRMTPQEKRDDPLTFECTPQDLGAIAAIVKRANEIGAQSAPPVAFNSVIACMDIAAVHCNGCPLSLMQMLMADNVDFMHDFAGIGLHVDRATGKLRHGFKPIFRVTKD